MRDLRVYKLNVSTSAMPTSLRVLPFILCVCEPEGAAIHYLCVRARGYCHSFSLCASLPLYDACVLHMEQCVCKPLLHLSQGVLYLSKGTLTE